MANSLKIFNYNQNEVRTFEIDGEPWFVLKDVCEVLEIENPRNVAARLDEDEKGVQLVDTLGGKQNATIINESGLYNVILRSDKPEAKPFRKWVTSEVLPTIRKTGGYIDKPLSSVEMFKLAAKAMDELNQRIDETNRRIDDIKDVVSLSTSNWREDSRKLIIKAANQIGGVAEIGKIYNDIYKIVEMKAGCNLSMRRENMKRRMLEQGLSPSKIKAISNIDAIASDKKLVEIFMATVKDAAIMYGVA